jgi:hypothetical protein
MTESNPSQRRRNAQSIAELVSRVIDPVTKKRGFATADLIAAWPEVAGARFAPFTRPVKITWPRGEANDGATGIMTLNVEGPAAILVQHELGQILERVNAFLGYQAVGQIRIVQAPVSQNHKRARSRGEPVLAAEDEQKLASATGGVADDGLRAALERLGRGVLGRPGVTGRSRQSP